MLAAAKPAVLSCARLAARNHTSMKNIGKSLLLPVETRAREFDGKLLLALHAAARGWEVVLGERHALHYALPRFAKSVYFSKGFRSGNRRLFPVIAGYGHRIVALDEEALLRFSDDVFRLKMEPEVIGCLEMIFAWGEDDARLYRSLEALQGKRIEVTGNPRMDIMRPALRRYFHGAIEDIRQRFGTFALLNSNFAMVNHFIANTTRFKMAQHADAEQVAEMKDGSLEHKRRLFDAFLASIPTLAAAAQPFNLVIRPHPSENHAPWLEAARGLANVHVLHEGSVIPWLAAASVLLHNGCTSAVEATVVGTPALAFRPHRSEQYDLQLANAVSRECDDRQTLAAEMRKLLDGSATAADQEQERQRRTLLAHHLANLEGPLACERLVDALDALWQEPGPALKAAFNPLHARFSHAQWRRRHRRLRGEDAEGKKAEYTLHKFPPISQAEVQQRVAQFSAALTRFSGVGLREMGKNLFVLKRN
jgi:surface carbohydrate biosynthesis protein